MEVGAQLSCRHASKRRDGSRPELVRPQASMVFDAFDPGPLTIRRVTVRQPTPCVVRSSEPAVHFKDRKVGGTYLVTDAAVRGWARQ